ncbi:DNA-binding transcriptional regulator, IclR family [Amycolatopsis marina]|uniref:DNA-binding transcriptional regulator, IclR family n=1 Tax=Amycolatopsis marina TaxID=490629 RepID=A0A1I0Z471_9PSEU|nr:helix-turn-helix domain-containing protein [Amycolatopsis marina]SFB19238.1 DNA-binding transcriptional regulator, IclR family [Amycolatopsis marina]
MAMARTGSSAQVAAHSAARRSPPTARVVRVLDFLVARQGRRFGLSEIARELGLSKPTCLGILTELTESGYLVRDEAARTYGLGPALIAAGRGAQRDFAAAGVARRGLAELSERYAATCTASAVVGEQIMILERTGAASGGAAGIGQRYPFAPPVGLMYVLWDADDEFDRWLAKEPTLPVRLDTGHLRRVVAECRRRGYLVESLSPAGLRLHSLLAGVAAYELPAEVRELVGEMVSSLGERVYLDADLAPRRKHPVSLLAAPTFDADGRQELVLTLHIGGAISGAEIERRGAALTEVAARVTAEVGGAPLDSKITRGTSGSR